jgi:hypothetical protein
MTLARALGLRPSSMVDAELAARRERPANWLVAGATGALGADMLKVCESHRSRAGGGNVFQVQVLTTERFNAAVGATQMRLAPSGPCSQWQPEPNSVDVLLVLFDPPRLYYQRERALWAPQPSDVPMLARWAVASGAHSIMLVQPHEQGRMPMALRAGLASLDEQAVAATGVQRLIVLRSARARERARSASFGARMAAHWWSVFGLMVPAQWQAPRSAGVAAFALACLRHAPPGVHVAAPEQVWAAAQPVVAPHRRAIQHPGPAAPPSWRTGGQRPTQDAQADWHARAWLVRQQG